jgi:hypothetical protein
MTDHTRNNPHNERRKRLESVRRRQAALSRQLEQEFGQLGSLEARVAELEGVRRQEEGRLRGLQKEVGGGTAGRESPAAASRGMGGAVLTQRNPPPACQPPTNRNDQPTTNRQPTADPPARSRPSRRTSSGRGRRCLRSGRRRGS